MRDPIEFQSFPKIARLSRECIVTEKIDGTNAAVRIATMTQIEATDWSCSGNVSAVLPIEGESERVRVLVAQSRGQFISPGHDNFGFAAWVRTHAEELTGLGEGIHFGEWWGSGIQRGYGLPKGERRFSLFNVSRWADDAVRPACCHLVPELWRGEFDTTHIRWAMDTLRQNGSLAVPGFMKPEGIVAFHVQGNLLFKKTFEKDEAGKEHGA